MAESNWLSNEEYAFHLDTIRTPTSYEAGNSAFKEGYEYTPDPPVTDKAKFECPVCLQILREPCQTPCGHRFCSGCIRKWIREQKKKCPIDNEPLNESQLFTDNFAKREILALMVKCPNNVNRCPMVIEIKQVEDHLMNCQYDFVPCPNVCSAMILKKHLSEHMKVSCPKRRLICQYCEQPVSADVTQEHLRSLCLYVPTKCLFCDKETIRGQLRAHHETSCMKAPVKCPYNEYGCLVQLERSRMAEHNEQNTAKHLELLLNFVKKLVTFMKTVYGEQLDLTTLLSEEPSFIDSNPVDSGIARTTSDGGLSPINSVLSTNVPHITSSQSISNHWHRGSADSLSTRLQDMGSTVSDPTTLASQFSDISLSKTVQKLTSASKYQEDKLTRTGQLVYELRGKCSTLAESVRSANQRIETLEKQLQELESRSHNGTYIWTIRNYTRAKLEAQTGQNSVVHSSGFYTSMYGYRVCMRLNINGVDSALGTHVSLFVHFMQGEYDTILNWPFHGRITLSILDQNEVSELRQHMTETYLAKPHLAAFQKPTTYRNHRGFGYMEFAPISVLENATYIKNDLLMIKAKIVVDE